MSVVSVKSSYNILETSLVTYGIWCILLAAIFPEMILLFTASLFVIGGLGCWLSEDGFTRAINLGLVLKGIILSGVLIGEIANLFEVL